MLNHFYRSANLEPFYQDCLEAHNTFRAKHGVPPVIWSAELASSAQKWADQLASSDQLRHDPKLNAAGIGGCVNNARINYLSQI